MKRGIHLNRKNDIINQFHQLPSWMNSIKGMDEQLWGSPLSDGKWSTSEVLAHILNWDQYLLAEILPSVRNRKEMNFPDFDPFNQLASAYAKSGISSEALLNEAIAVREQLINQLIEMPDELLTYPLPVNGVSHCPHTGRPYSLIFIIEDFIEHDNHHKQEIVRFLHVNNIN